MEEVSFVLVIDSNASLENFHLVRCGWAGIGSSHIKTLEKHFEIKIKPWYSNDKWLEENREILETKYDMLFLPNWKENPVYRNSLKTALENIDKGHIYMMHQMHGCWRFRRAHRDDINVIETGFGPNIVLKTSADNLYLNT